MKEKMSFLYFFKLRQNATTRAPTYTVWSMRISIGMVRRYVTHGMVQTVWYTRYVTHGMVRMTFCKQKTSSQL